MVAPWRPSLKGMGKNVFFLCAGRCLPMEEAAGAEGSWAGVLPKTHERGAIVLNGS